VDACFAETRESAAGRKLAVEAPAAGCNVLVSMPVIQAGNVSAKPQNFQAALRKKLLRLVRSSSDAIQARPTNS